jgi:alkylation response protein AidB-like acyl-CoA dehydrogenase
VIPERAFLGGPAKDTLELGRSAHRYLAENYSIAKRRQTIAARVGYDREIWKVFAELGWLALPFAESDGGLGCGPEDLAALMRELGHAAVLEPYLDAIVLTGSFLAACPDGALRGELIAKTISGLGIATFALLDSTLRAPHGATPVQARRRGDGVELTGERSFVPFAAQADVILVPAVLADEPVGAFAVYALASSDLELRVYELIDGATAADFSLQGTWVSDARLVAPRGAAKHALELAIRVATYCVCAEAVAIMTTLLQTTADYLQSRKQFGQPLAKFQVLQHTVADMTTALALADAAVWAAGNLASSQTSPHAEQLLAAAKFEVGRAGRFIGQRAIHLHGGIGMTDELAVGHLFKRLVAIDALFGNALHQLCIFNSPVESRSART